MQNEFIKYIRENNLFTKKDKLLVAVSGGLDSIVLCELLLQNGFEFAIAHCNFHLRGEESNRDEAFVKNYVEKNNIKEFFVASFDTETYMKERKVSVEMAARELRYKWFDRIMSEKKLDYLVTGHHADDSAETIFINILRGTGIAGLHGILPKTNNIVRPLLFATKAHLAEYADKNHIEHIEDSSNQNIEIIRNRIRQEIFPIFREIAPNFDITVRREIERFRQTEQVFRSVIDRVRTEILISESDCIKMPIEKLKTLTPLKIFLFELFSEYGFNESTINAIEESLFEDLSGKQFFSDEYRAIRDRQYIIISRRNYLQTNECYLINPDDFSLDEPLPLKLEVMRDMQFISIPQDRNIAMLDFDKLTFPLMLRKWKKGDSFIPLGLNKQKKLSDFFTNLKYSLLDKENQWLLCSGEEIVWIVGKRLDDRFKVTENTVTIYRMELL
ncbi:MAG: tRNA lysidine(34) synthetase TilS [Bacteroidales bacterium]|jgi:tRNA(Ile)-lysidine synthase|nr:tRNA lysidine(34) synthetase TilS [Bacteroidales bacterium]